VIPEEMNITMKQVDSTIKDNTSLRFPMEMTIEETLRLRADEKKKIKEFNYKFHNNVSKKMSRKESLLTKRLGIDISTIKHNSVRISVGTDSTNDLQLF
jgi:cell division protein FtsZ